MVGHGCWEESSVVSQITYIVIRTCSSTLSCHVQIVWIASKLVDVLPHPFEGHFLIPEAIIGLVASFAEFVRCQKPSRTQSIALWGQQLRLDNKPQNLSWTYLIETATIGKFFSADNRTSRPWSY